MNWLFPVFVIFLFGTSKQEEEAECPEDEVCNLKLIQGPSGQLCVSNFQNKKGAIIDYENELSIIFRELEKEIIIMDIPNENAMYVSLKDMEFNKEATMEEYILKTPVQSLRDKGKKQASKTLKIESLTEEQEDIMDDVIKNIEPETIDFEKNNKKSVARIFIGLVKKLIRMIRYNPLRTFIRERIKNSIVYGGFTRIIGIFAGITELLRETSGRILRALLSKTLSIPRLLVTRSSSLILALILKSMKTGASLVLAPIIRSPMTLYRLIHKFGGGVYKGLRGIEALIGHLILFVKRRISLKSLIDIIIQVCATIGKFQINAFKKVIGLILSIIKTVIRGNPISRGLWNGIINFLEKLKNGGLIIHKFNISSIIDLIVKAQTLKLRVLIRICKALRSLISIPKTIAMLFFRMVYFVVSGKGIAFVRRLLPNLHINLDFSRSKEPVIVQIVKLMHPKNLVRSLMSLNIEKLITSIPIIGNIYSTLIETLQEIPAGKPDLIRGLKEDDLKNTLVSWVQYGMGQGGSSPTGEICGMGLSDDEVPLIIEVP